MNDFIYYDGRYLIELDPAGKYQLSQDRPGAVGGDPLGAYQTEKQALDVVTKLWEVSQDQTKEQRKDERKTDSRSRGVSRGDHGIDRLNGKAAADPERLAVHLHDQSGDGLAQPTVTDRPSQ